jgi:alanine dehydrogenase
VLILNADEVWQALPMRNTIEAMKKAYAALSDGRADVPLRTRLSISRRDATSLFMPAYVQMDDGEALGIKIVSLFPENTKRGLPFIQAAVLVLDADTGRAIALLEGGTLTAIRTGAGSGAAIDLLARPESRVAAIFGAGAQGRAQLEAACTIRKIETAWVYDHNLDRAQVLAKELAGRGPIPNDLRVAHNAKEAITDADIICAATTSLSPVFTDRDLKPGVHISAVGSYTPEMQEVPAETVYRARVVVDSRAATLAETGDLIQPMRAGLFTEAHIHSELGEIVLGRKKGRQSPDEITYFKSVGIGVQDVVAAQLALDNAREMKLGHEVDF